MSKIILYHGTSQDRLKSILEKGILPREEVKDYKNKWKKFNGKNNESQSGLVYLTNIYGFYFANMSDLKGLILKVKVDMDKLIADEDCYKFTKSINYKQNKLNWKDSLDSLGVVAHKGLIKPEQIINFITYKIDLTIFSKYDWSINPTHHKIRTRLWKKLFDDDFNTRRNNEKTINS